MTRIMTFSLLLNLLFVFAAVIALHQKGGLPWIMRKINPPAHAGNPRDTRQSVYDALPVGPEDTVFVGDSILAFGEWAELMNDPHCKNRAIAGSTTADVLARLSPIITGHPKRIILLAGINDIQGEVPLSATLSNLAQIIDRIKSESPQTVLTVLPVMPVNKAIYAKWIIPEHPGIHMPTIGECSDINSALSPVVQSEGLLQDAANTNDGLHLNGRGLVELAKIIK